ncbi:MAG: TonB family protein [Terracidiphilus sp.]|nr:TonB family protein [Terracidiphilus sp.]
MCAICGAEQSAVNAFCKQCSSPLGGAPIPERPRCPVCGAAKEPGWRVCERCGAGTELKSRPSRWFAWPVLAAFTALWVAGLAGWWFFSYRITIGPLVAGSVVEIDGKQVGTLSASHEYSSPLLTRGLHSFVVKAPGRQRNAWTFRTGFWSLRRHFASTQVPEIACVTVNGPPNLSVSVGARKVLSRDSSEFCAPAGTTATIEWRSDPAQPPKTRQFQYSLDGDVIDLASSATEQGPPTEAAPPVAAPVPPSAPSQPPANPAAARQHAAQLVQGAQALFERRNYKAALAACDQALKLDPKNGDAQQLRSRIRQTMQVLGIDPQAHADKPGQKDFAPAPTIRNNSNSGGQEAVALRVGNGVSAPVAIFKPEPEYSEAARTAKLQGKVTLDLIVNVDGRPSQVRVAQPLGMGLDEKAVEAVRKWRFRPGSKDGHAVPIQAKVEVRFRLL